MVCFEFVEVLILLRDRPMQMSIGFCNILSVSVLVSFSVSDSVNELLMEFQYLPFKPIRSDVILAQM